MGGSLKIHQKVIDILEKTKQAFNINICYAWARALFIELFYLLRPMTMIKQAFINQLMLMTKSNLKGPPISSRIHMCIRYQVLFKVQNMMPHAYRLCKNPWKCEFKEKVLFHFFFKKNPSNTKHVANFIFVGEFALN